jgi:hypothetical protein
MSPFESLFSRKLVSFRAEVSLLRIEYDASLTGAGFIISSRVGESSFSALQYTGITFPFDLHADSSFQNSCEFIAVVLALYVVWRITKGNIPYEIIGDSKASLTWCLKGYAKSSLAKRASIAFTVLGMLGDLRLQSADHIPGHQNVVCDSLSRGVSLAVLDIPPALSTSESLMIDLTNLLNIINPSLPQDSIEDCYQDLLVFLRPHRRSATQESLVGSI